VLWGCSYPGNTGRLLRKQLPELKVRVINVVDLSDPEFDCLFTTATLNAGEQPPNSVE
jgi:hypothetical protein